MRILSVVRSLEVAAGGSTAAASSIRGLVEQFAETDLIGLGFREKSDKGVIMFSAARLLGRFGWSNSMRRWLRSNICSYDLVFINSIFDWTAISAANAARKAGVPYLIWPHNSLDPYDLRQHSLMKKALATVYWEPLIRNSAGIIFTIEREASASYTFGAQVRKFVLPLPVAVGDPIHITRDESRRSLDLPVNCSLALFLGRVNYKKGLPLLLEALNMPVLSSVHLAIAGRGEPSYERRIKELSMSLQITERIHWLGWLEGDQKAAALNAVDCFVLLSENENFGLAAIEAVQAGCPVLVSEDMYIAQELEAEGLALAVPRRLPEVTESLRHILDHPEEVLAGREHRMEFSRRRWSIANLTHEYLAVCEAIVNGDGK